MTTSLFGADASVKEGERYFLFASLKPKYWVDLADGLKRFATLLSEETYHCERIPARLVGRREYDEHADRLKRCISFGQHLQRLPHGRQEFGQFGLYGTAAGLELLTGVSAAYNAERTPHETYSNDERAWASRFLRTWNFLDLSVRELSGIERSKFWDETRTTLRLCNMLRGISVAKPFLTLLGNGLCRHRAGCDSKVLDDIGSELSGETANALGKVLVQNLQRARVRSSDLGRGFRIQGESQQFTFRFGQEADDVPETWRDWLFVWGTVIVAICDALKAGIVDEAQVATLCCANDITLIEKVLSDRKRYEDDRYRLYALWALSHLSRMGAGDDMIRGIPLQLEIGGARSRFVASESIQTCRRLIRNEVELTDVHCPYQIFFAHRVEGERYRDDYFVIPVAPLVLWLVARWQPAWLFRPRVSELYRGWSDPNPPRQPDGSLHALRFQIGPFNGTVNSIYYRQTALLIAMAVEHSSAKAFWLAAVGRLRDRVFESIALVVLAVTAALLFYGDQESKVVIFTLGVAAELIATIIYHWLRHVTR